MTLNIKNTVKSKEKAAWIVAALSVFYIITAIVFSKELVECIIDALRDSIYKVIPAIFPFMVISKLLVKSDIITVFDKVTSPIVTRIFNLPRSASSALLLSLLSGFPIGASVVSDLYKSGKLTKEEAELSLCLTHNTGPAFPVSVIGLLLWDSIAFGAAVYASQIISLVLLSQIFKTKRTRPDFSKPMSIEGHSIARSLTASLSESALSCVMITGSIVFWKTTSELLFRTIQGVPQTLNVLASGFLEFSSGAIKASLLHFEAGAILTGFFIGFGGICVFLQAILYTSEVGLSMKKCFLFKLMHGFLCGILSLISYLLIF